MFILFSQRANISLQIAVDSYDGEMRLVTRVVCPDYMSLPSRPVI